MSHGELLYSDEHLLVISSPEAVEAIVGPVHEGPRDGHGPHCARRLYSVSVLTPISAQVAHPWAIIEQCILVINRRRVVSCIEETNERRHMKDDVCVHWHATSSCSGDTCMCGIRHMKDDVCVHWHATSSCSGDTCMCEIRHYRDNILEWLIHREVLLETCTRRKLGI